MPSLILGNPDASGSVCVFSGNPWSGQSQQTRYPQTGFQLAWVCASGNAYIGLSGGGPGIGLTINSGRTVAAGGVLSGMNDGFPLAPPYSTYFIPRASLPFSGTYNLWASCDAIASGVGRLYVQVF